ncbi:methyl-accepting chemotaxis protein [Novipirellula artificiosorum]|uniref:Putative methyl-accepting chemotaxis protein YoaH n=1 Tax=Novipirellula artificiosorum TaxID=2528016 RepID=A0A5C6D6F6_9BACT|nr:methyl-accepting chemotaxis protein [Novipirellula artificiosorum]TWU30826.1 putative methyl-accepting chemotaxis protein YoaH [Novipirellula artificiosorum]
MLELIHKIRRRLVGRMLLFVVLPTLLIFALVIYLSSLASFKNLRQSEEEYIQLQARVVATQIEDLNASAVISAQRMADAQVAGMFGDREASIEYARIVLENFDGITGAYFGYEPNADGQDSESLGKLPTEAMDPNGRFIPYWFVDSTKGRTTSLEPLVDMESSLYYNGAKKDFEKTGKPAYKVTEPYVYQGKMITEQVYPIVIDGQFKGVAGVDFALADIDTMLRRIAKSEEFDIFLISANGNFIAASLDPVDGELDVSNERLLTRNVEDIQAAELFVRLMKDKNMNAPLLEVDPSEGEKYYFAAARVPVGNWTVVVRKPESIVLAPIWAQLRSRLIFALSGIFLIIALLLAMTVRLARRVNEAVEAAKRIAAGDLTGELEFAAPEECVDETGVLLHSIGNMTVNLNRLVGNVKQASIQLNSTATELSATSHQQKATASSFGSSANQIAAATKQISSTNTELLGTMENVSQVAVGTAELATAGRSGLQNMEESMRDLDKATGSIGEKLAVINDKASNITGVVSTITKVADQTNLLSVNAAIEAEKAGEYGVGFLVVAREIRRLADQTSAATLDIEQMVRQMLSAVSAGVMEMDRFTDHVRRNVKDVATISQQMSDIIEQVNSNTQQFESVNESMQSQAQGAEQISSAMGQLTAHAAQSSDAIHEYSRAADDLQQAIESLKSSIASFQLKS